MADTPQILSKEQILGDLVDGFIARVENVNDLSRQSVLMQFLEAVAQVDFRAYADIIQMLDSQSVDRAVGEALQKLARDRNVAIQSGKASSGRVTVTDITFAKTASQVYAGQPAPVAGSQKIYVADASKFSAQGTIYLGRKTPNVEGPLQYTSVQAEGGGAYWSITLAGTSLTTKFHNIGEEVVQGRGGKRQVPSGTVVQTPQGATVTSVSFKTVSTVYILDGETTVTDIPVVCLDVGIRGNIPKGAIKSVVGLPFDATVSNSNPFSDGQAPDTDDQLRDRIKQSEATKSKGTEAAIQLSSINVISPDELKKVVSSAIVRYADESAALVFDDGTGYEPIFTGVGMENIVDEALGGEAELQLRKKPIAQARVQNNIVGPYTIVDGDSLDINVQGDVRTHTFAATDFKVPSSATVSEMATSINSNPSLHIYATTAENQVKLVLFPRDRTKNSIQVLARTTQDANLVLGFPTTEEFTSRFYRNEKPIYQDGIIPLLLTRAKSLWASNVSGPSETLIYSVDGSPAITVTLTDADFQSVQAGSIIALADITIWAEVFNTKLAGITTTVNGEQLQLASNLGANARASVEIVGGTLAEKIFPVGVALYTAGRASDYTLNKQTGQLTLVTPLLKGESLTAGSTFTRAKFLTSAIPNGPASAGNIWLVVDGASEQITSGIRPNTKVDFLNLGTDHLKIVGTSATTLAPEGFETVQVGDWMLIWGEATDATSYPTLTNHKGHWRVETVKAGEITVKVGDNAAFINGTELAIPTDRILFVRSEAPLQRLSYGIQTLSQFAKFIPTAIEGVGTEVLGSKVRVYTKTAELNGELFVLAADMAGRSIGAPVGTVISNLVSHLGHTATSDSEASTPLFTYDSVTAALNDHALTIPALRDLGGEVGLFLEPTNGFDPSTQTEIVNSNAARRVMIKSFDDATSTLDYKTPKYMTGLNKINAGDKFFVRKSYQFDSKDSLTVVVDGDATTKSYNLNIARKLSVDGHSTPALQSFSAADAESSLALKDAASFYDFDFSGFKAWRRAHAELTDGTYSIAAKFIDFGPSGDDCSVGLGYPNSVLVQSPTLLTKENNIEIMLPVKTVRTANWGGTTAFTVNKTTTGGKDVLTYTYRIGDIPDFSSLGADVNVGDIAIISRSAYFLAGNKEIQGRVASVTATSFTIEIPTGDAESDNLNVLSIINQNGVTEIKTDAAHQLLSGDRIGLYGTAETFTGSGIRPFDSVEYVTVVDSTTFNIRTPISAPQGLIASATHSNGIVTITAPSHGLVADQIVLISNVPILAYNGIHAVTVLNANQFQYVVAGSSAAISTGRYDFQPYTAVGTPITITGTTQSSYDVTAQAPLHGLTTGSIAKITGVAMSTATWAFGNNYYMGDIVFDTLSGDTYIAIADDIGSTVTPGTPSNPLWALFTGALPTHNLTAIVTSTPTPNSFTYVVGYQSNLIGTGGSAQPYSVTGQMARALGSAGSNLAFVDCTITAQNLCDQVNTAYADFISLINTGDGLATISRSTADLDIFSNYYSGTITAIKTTRGSNIVQLTTTLSMPTGAQIKTNGQSYQLFAKEQVGPNYVYSAYNGIVHQITATSVVSWPMVGIGAYRMFADGQNFIETTNLQSLTGTPQFTLSYPWALAPAIGEEVRVVAQTADQLVRFWNKLVVTGITNVCSVDLVEYGRQIQIMSNVFGSDGSIQIAGGIANDAIVALSGSSSELTHWGQIVIPYQARYGLNAGQWIRVTQTIRQNKIINLSPNTILQVFNDGLEILSGTGSFQVQKTTTVASDSVIKVEHHGKFVAFIGVDGPALGLSDVKEGDWVRVSRYKNHLAWAPATPYVLNDKVTHNGYSWRALQSSTTQEPIAGSAFWQRLGFSLSSEGVFQVVRVYGDIFWVESANAADEIVVLDDASELTFYAYDSIMPNDTLIVSGSSLGVNNIGRFTVVDDSYGLGYQFPTSTRIYTTLIPQATGGGVAIGDYYSQINIEEHDPISLLKRVMAVIPDMGQSANVILDTPNLVNKLSISLGAQIAFEGKLDFTIGVAFGVDSYRYYQGLISELNRVVYGDPTNSAQYPGYRAAGTSVDIKPSVIKKISIALSVRVKTGLPFSEIRERVKSSVAGYVNLLGVGQQVSLSKVVEAASKINGVTSVVITQPTYNATSDLIYVGPDQKAQVVDPSSDINVSVLGL